MVCRQSGNESGLHSGRLRGSMGSQGKRAPENLKKKQKPPRRLGRGSGAGVNGRGVYQSLERPDRHNAPVLPRLQKKRHRAGTIEYILFKRLLKKELDLFL